MKHIEIDPHHELPPENLSNNLHQRDDDRYKERNYPGASRPLPDFFWTGKTEMACLATVISETITNAYAHHIQRLMVTGNFAMLAGLDPSAVHQRYLEVDADAFEWVELPNVIGMSQFADGGMIGSKPYASSGAYLSQMSDYCETCRYDVRKRPAAAPVRSMRRTGHS